MVRSVYIPYSVKMSAEAAFLARAQGDMPRVQSDLKEQTDAAEAELDALLESGYSVVTSHILDTSHQSGMLILLHKRGQDESTTVSGNGSGAR